MLSSFVSFVHPDLANYRPKRYRPRRLLIILRLYARAQLQLEVRGLSWFVNDGVRLDKVIRLFKELLGVVLPRASERHLRAALLLGSTHVELPREMDSFVYMPLE